MCEMMIAYRFAKLGAKIVVRSHRKHELAGVIAFGLICPTMAGIVVALSALDRIL